MRFLDTCWLAGLCLICVSIDGVIDRGIAQQVREEGQPTVQALAPDESVPPLKAGATGDRNRTQTALAALLKDVEKSEGDLERDVDGNVISIALRHTNANNRALLLVSSVGSLRELSIFSVNSCH